MQNQTDITKEKTRRGAMTDFRIREELGESSDAAPRNKMNIKGRLEKKEILTVPNALSLFRILLIPVIFVLYCKLNKHIGAVCVIALSGLTDTLDGYIARKYNMVTDFGKLLDPVADKLTQAAMIICLISRYRLMYGLIILLAIKECFQLMGNYYILKLTDTMHAAKWYGKLSTFVLYASMITLFLYPSIPDIAANVIIGVCAAVMLLAMVLYGRFFFVVLRECRRSGGSTESYSGLWKGVLVLCWAAIIMVFVLFAKNLSLESILQYTPASPFLAALVMLLLYALKSLSFVMYMGILYAASGLIFPLPAAIIINVLGTAIEVTIPYCIGRSAGTEFVSRLLEHYPKVKTLQSRCINEFGFLLTVRLIGGLPMDAVSMYFGAAGAGLFKNMAAGVLGMLPRLIAFTVMGMSADDVSSPVFLLSALAAVITIIATALAERHRNKTLKDNETIKESVTDEHGAGENNTQS